MINSEFISLATAHFSGISKFNFEKEFYIKSLTTTNDKDFEFGLHARTKDIFIESLVRNGLVSEVELDEGCCEV